MFQYPPRRSRSEKLAIRVAERLTSLQKPIENIKPGEPCLVVVCVSDTHSQTFDLPPGNLIIHAGDLTGKGSFEQLQETLNWLNEQPHEHKVVIGGNHDLILDANFPNKTEPGKTKDDLKWGSITYLEDSTVDLTFRNGRKLKIYGNPFTPQFGNFAFQYPRQNADFWNGKIPDDADVVVTHGPPRFHRDANSYGGHVGCESLLRELYRAKPGLLVCGHIHESAGQEVLAYDEVQQGLEAALRNKFSLSVMTKMVWSSVTSSSGVPKRFLLVNAAVMKDWRNGDLRPALTVTL